MVGDPLIRVAGLVRVFGPTRVLDGVTFDVAAGEAVALLGPNGAGKTTLLKIVATLLRPTRGTVRVGSHDCVSEAEAVRAIIGVVAHGVHVYDDLTARENLKFWATLAGLPADRDTLAQALAEVDLERHAETRVRTFSAGMKRRLALARVGLGRPRVLLLDEPFAGLDARARKWLEGRLETFKSAGGALLMATHSFGRELGTADRLAILAGGRIVLDTPRAALGPDDIQRLYVAHTEEAS
ncbi:MAG: heme ABC exporter ATP-binding protein CcmA [Candidatus Rokuibacteriota bacterium]|nr:MAG: heme ABC exporter ATP-binding protein CcmA [Candidatus Rokubacteria bacterium]